MNPVSLIDWLLFTISGLLSIGWGVLFYILRSQAAAVKETAALVLSENRITASLVLAEKEKLAALVMTEKEKLAAAVKIEHDILEEKFIAFRIKVAEEYATTKLLEQITKPLLLKLDDIEKLLNSKLDRREFEQHIIHGKND